MINIKKEEEKTIIKLTILSFTIYMIGILLLGAIVYTIVGIGILSFLGFTYDSYRSAVLFFIICYIMLIPADYYISFLIELFKIKSKISKFQQRVIDFILYTSFSSMVVGIVDYFMIGISISPSNQVLFIFLYYLLLMYSDNLLLSK